MLQYKRTYHVIFFQANAPKDAADDTSEIPPPPPVSELPPAADEEQTLPNEAFSMAQELLLTSNELPVFSSADPSLGSSDTSSLASADHSSTRMENDEQNAASPGKRKASSLGDLTKLEHAANKKASTSAAILERAVSLDLQVRNLVYLKPIVISIFLHPRTFTLGPSSYSKRFLMFLVYFLPHTLNFYTYKLMHKVFILMSKQIIS